MQVSSLLLVLAACIAVVFGAQGCSIQNGRCIGQCEVSMNPQMCVMYAPGKCGCKECAFDYSYDNCVGVCLTQFNSEPSCVLTSNHTCACKECGWETPSLSSCTGTCI
ncbi:hypothetical protein KIPB_010759, partial [Kipferlia bialata]|eukprot:g10759.t1